MLALLQKIIKDVCTVANGDDYCIAGIFGLVSLIVGIVVAIIAIIVCGSDVVKLGDFLMKFAAFIGSVITTVCTGKMIKKGAEPE